jgi:ATP-dependent DNA ligase
MARFPFDPLPDGFVLGKPVDRHSYDEKEIYELEKRGDLIITRKRDGWKIYATIKGGTVRLYTAGGNEIDGRLDHVKKDLLACKIPSPALIAGEGVIDIIHDDIGKVGSIFNANLKRSLELQKEYGKIRFMPFGLIHWGGRSVISDPYEKNLSRLGSALCHFYELVRAGLTYITPIHILTMSFDEAKKLVVEKGWEGLVLYDRNFANNFVLDGTSPDRPSGCYKWKPIFEDDFIARSWIPSPKNPSVVKDVVLFQKDPATGKEFLCGKFGTFSKKLKKELADDSKYPFVIQLEFDARYPKSGKIRGPRYVRIRTDKRVEDCISPKSYPVK